MQKRRQRRQAINYQPSTINDPLAQAVEREREFRQVGLPEWDGVWAHVFRCVCCGRLRGEQERREPNSEVCLRCVQEAGFFN